MERYFAGSLVARADRRRLPKRRGFSGLRAASEDSDDCQDGKRTQNQFHVLHISSRTFSPSRCFELISIGRWGFGVGRFLALA